MKMVRSEDLVYEYVKRDEEGNVTGTHRAIDHVDSRTPTTRSSEPLWKKM